jgi:hypothetical protein
MFYFSFESRRGGLIIFLLINFCVQAIKRLDWYQESLVLHSLNLNLNSRYVYLPFSGSQVNLFSPKKILKNKI